MNIFFSEIGAVDELVEKKGLNVLSARDEWGYTPAHWAALDGNIEVSFFYEIILFINFFFINKNLFIHIYYYIIGNEIFNNTKWTSRSFLSWNSRTKTNTLGLSKRS